MCRYAYSVYCMRNESFLRSESWWFERDLVRHRKEFKFTMVDIARLREDMRVFIERLSRMYLPWKNEHDKALKEERRKAKQEKLRQKETPNEPATEDSATVDNEKNATSDVGTPGPSISDTLEGSPVDNNAGSPKQSTTDTMEAGSVDNDPGGIESMKASLRNQIIHGKETGIQHENDHVGSNDLPVDAKASEGDLEDSRDETNSGAKHPVSEDSEGSGKENNIQPKFASPKVGSFTSATLHTSRRSPTSFVKSKKAVVEGGLSTRGEETDEI